jgi:uroporphyrinogen III methyltransferase / synthase
MTVYLVGAGPGDPGLLTMRAVELISRAEVIIYDRLIPQEALEGARSDAELIYAGKEGGGESMSQEEINRLLIEHGTRSVVRLKGGDPFVFGRGGEEVEALLEAGIPFEVVPGVTAGVAAPAYAGIPATHRDAASAVAFVTGHEDPTKAGSALDWDALARFPGTLVVYMGVRRLGPITDRLIAAGRNPEEPAAVIERGTLPGQRVLAGTLATIATAGARAPAIAVFGEVAALREALPLAGIRVAVTRARAQASGLATRLQMLGAHVIEAPAIRIEPLGGPPPELERYDLVCLTSPNGVRLLFDRLAGAGRDARALAGARVAAIGPGTAAALRAHGVEPDVVPERFVAEGLVEALGGVPVEHALVARAAEARDVLVDALRERGAEVDVVALYETVAEPLSDAQLEAIKQADYVTFTSSSTVRYLLDSAALAPGTRIASIGPVTSAALRERGHEPHVEAVRHDIDGLVQALLEDATNRSDRDASPPQPPPPDR